MTIFTSDKPLMWGGLDVPLLGLSHDWQGNPVEPLPAFSVITDPVRLWFIATHRQPAALHPAARPGQYQRELWKYDVAELFLGHAKSGRYFEFNLAPNGAWWTCEFTAPRVREEEADIVMPEVATFADVAPDGAWMVAMAIPLDLLRARLDFGPETLGNVTMILNSPEQKFLSATKLPGEEPDFHQPSAFKKVQFMGLQEVWK